jgi:hypothetical protein
MGVMIKPPCLYVDTSDAWLCERKSEKIFISMAGPLSTLLIGCMLVIICQFTSIPFIQPSIQFLIHLCFFSVLLSLDPIASMDGYYSFMDLVDIPNLKIESLEFFKRIFDFNSIKSKEYTKREKISYISYGFTAVVITLFVIMYAVFLCYDILFA